MDPCEIQRVVGMRDHVAKSSGAYEAVRQWRFDNPRSLQSAKRVSIRLWGAGAQRDARGDRKVDDNLCGLPEVKNYGIRRVG